MTDNAHFKVAMIAHERQDVPEWVRSRLDAIAGLQLTYGRCRTEADLLALAGDADMIWTMAANTVITPAVLPKLRRCKAIFRSGSGMDGYPVAEASALGIAMCNSPESISEAVAEHAVSLLFALVRQIPFSDRRMRGDKGSNVALRWHISGSTFGLVGFGRIGKRVCEMMAGFRMTMLVHDPYTPVERIRACGAEPVELNDLLVRADFVSLHCPLTDQTWHLIGAKELAAMKPGALLVNTSRGAVIDETALIAALRQGRLGGAALDVTDPEPPLSGSPLFALPNVILTPHNAALSGLFEHNFWDLSIQVILECQRGDFKTHCMNRRELDSRPPTTPA